VRHASLHLVPVQISTDAHSHGGESRPHEHVRA